MKRGKKYLHAKGMIEAGKLYSHEQGVELVKQVAFASFDETIELSIRLNLKKGATVRDTVVLPHQFSAKKKILVFAKGEKAQEAKDAGAEYVGDVDLIDKIKGGWLDFDVAVATPDMMKDVGKLGQILGRRGLMPNPKTQTVTLDVKEALAQLRLGRIEYRSDKTGVLHLAVGKISMESEKVVENISLLLDVVAKKKTADDKGEFIRSAAISSTMGPGVMLDYKQAAGVK